MTDKQMEEKKKEFETLFEECGYYQSDNFWTLWHFIEKLVEEVEREARKEFRNPYMTI